MFCNTGTWSTPESGVSACSELDVIVTDSGEVVSAPDATKGCSGDNVIKLIFSSPLTLRNNKVKRLHA
jgi:hypothetical protein